MLPEKYQKALDFTFTLHRDDLRKGKQTPYLAHLLSVSALVLEDDGTETEAIAALLHDSLEDHADTFASEALAEQFGKDVADIVAGCSDTLPDYKGGKKPPWKERKLAYLDHLKQASPSVLWVALADKLHNARGILNDLNADGPSVWDRFNADRADQIWYFDKLLRIFADKISDSRSLVQFKDVVERIKEA